MRPFLPWIGKKLLNGVISAIFFVLWVLGIVYAAISWPSGNPGGSEVTGGRFMTYFNNMFGVLNYCWANQAIKGFDTNGNAVCTSAGWIGSVTQSWQVPWRWAGVGYTNTTGAPIMIAVYWGWGNGANFWCVVGGVTVGYGYGSNSNGDSDAHNSSISAIVPIGASYYCYGSILHWAELR